MLSAGADGLLGLAMAGFLTLEEAAQRLGVEYKTVYRLVRSGELPAGKIGRIYRIRESDLEAYFEQQKQQLAQQARDARPMALQGQTCGVCAAELVSRLSVGGTCEVCDAPICQACWAIKKARRCAAHAEVAEPANASAPSQALPKDQPGGAAPAPRVDDITSQIKQLRDAGRPVTTPGEACLAEEGFIRAFAQRLEAMPDLPDPLSKRRIALPQARVKHELRPTTTATADGPGNLMSRFRLRTGGWGRPKAGLVLEARFLSRPERLVEQGYDADPLGEADLSAILEDLRQQARREDCYHAVILGSPTGWDEATISIVTRAGGGRSFKDRRVGVTLYDLHGDQAHLDQHDDRLREFWPLLAPAQFAGELARCVVAVAKLLGGMDGVALDFAAKTLGLPLGWIRAAFEQLSQTGSYALEELPKLGPVLEKKATSST